MEKENKAVSTISVIIPVYNEKKTILETLEKVKKAPTGGLKKEIIIVDDGSEDGTKDIVRNLNNVKVFFHETNQGKGAAIKTALKHATGDILLIQDADAEYDPSQYPLLLDPIMNKGADVVYGSRFFDGYKSNKNMYYSHAFGNMLLTAMTNILYGSKLNDMETCYKVIKRDVLNDINLNAARFEIEPELTAKILKKGKRIQEVAIAFEPRSFEEGKKINWKDGVIAIWTLVKYRFHD